MAPVPDDFYKEGMRVTLRGTFVRHRFYDESSGFVIGTLEPSVVSDATGAVLYDSESPRPGQPPACVVEAVVKGVVPSFEEGGIFVMSGDVEFDRRYGTQVRVKSATKVTPSTTDEMEAFLAASGIHGLGPATAARIVGWFGEDTYKVLTEDIERVREVKGVSETLKESIIREMPAKAASVETVAFFASLGFTPRLIERLTSEYGAGAKDVVTRNPYILTRLRGFAFTRADAIARRLGVGLEDPIRIDAGVIATLKWMCDSAGHTLVPASELLPVVYSKLGLDPSRCEGLVAEGIDRLVECGRLVSTDAGLQLPWLHREERRIASGVARMARPARDRLAGMVASGEVANAMRLAGRELGYEPTEEQASVTPEVFSNGLTVLTGAGGTGKTTAIMLVTETARRLGVPFVLCSPTGKAAKRLGEACTPDGGSQVPAFTLHRALAIGVVDDDATSMATDGTAVATGAETDATRAFNAARLVLCDEVSMLDTALAAELIGRCAEDGKHLLMIGDPHQLPSVGPGQVLRDLIGMPFVPHVTLTRIHRYAEEGGVLAAANAVLEGCSPCDVPGVVFHDCEDGDVQRVLDEHVIPLVEAEGLGFEDIAFISPMRRRSAVSGVEGLNAHLRPILNRMYVRPENPDDDFRLQPGDFVSQTSNDYERGRFNGDQGVVESTDGGVTVSFLDDGVPVSYSPADASDELMLAYASTVHRYQGSQCRTVVLVMTSHHRIMATRNLLYTAVTRAESRLILVGDRATFAYAARNASDAVRHTGLSGDWGRDGDAGGSV